MKWKKSSKWLLIVAVVVLAGLAAPVANLIVGAPISASIAGIETDDPLFAEARDILARKCSNCHTPDYALPFYAKFPIAQGIIEKDITDGIRYFDMAAGLNPGEGLPAMETALAKIEYTVDQGTMPPMRYVALHWDGGLSSAEKEALHTWIRETRVAHYAPADLPREVQERAVHPIPAAVIDDPARVALGDRLFHDPRLSKDNSISCASCHGLDMGGVDRAKVATGVGGAQGPINSPTVYNAVFNIAQFWDGRAADLRAQASGPVTNPLEMAATFDEVVPKLDQDAAFKAEFLKVYPEGISEATITDAIAAFEETLVTPNSRFDQYLLGDASALNEQELRGYETFTRTGCAICHVGKAMGGQSYEKMGRAKDYFADRGGVNEADYGRFKVTGDEKDRFAFKTPLLRNIAQTYPYFHDATTEDLGEATRVMAEYQFGVELTDAEVADITAFLHTLTGEYQGQLLQ